MANFRKETIYPEGFESNVKCHPSFDENGEKKSENDICLIKIGSYEDLENVVLKSEDSDDAGKLFAVGQTKSSSVKSKYFWKEVIQIKAEIVEGQDSKCHKNNDCICVTLQENSGSTKGDSGN